MSWQYLDKQMLPFIDRLTNEIKISEEIAEKLATNIAANVRFLSTEIKKEIKSATPIPINDRLSELKAFQGWMDFANTIEKNPFITRYNTPQKLDKGIRWMLACHIKKEAEYGKEHSENP